MDAAYESAPMVHFPRWCPDCDYTLDEKNNLTENAELVYCREHTPSDAGHADRRASPLGDRWDPAVNAEQSDQSLCDFIHRGTIRTDG
jgi:hypothetical protein